MLSTQQINLIRQELEHGAEFLTLCFESTERAHKTTILGLARALSEICEQMDCRPCSSQTDVLSADQSIEAVEASLESFRKSNKRWNKLGADRGAHIANLLKIRGENEFR